LNEAMPQWRSFSSGSPDGPPRLPPAGDEGDRDRPWWLVPALIGGGGLVVGAAAAALLVLTLMSRGSADVAGPRPDVGDSLDQVAAIDEVQPGTPAPEILVDVAGAVARPGLHRLQAGARVGDAIVAAGGFGPRADLAAASEVLNLALLLQDGTKVSVPELGTGRAERATESTDGRIDLNSAGQGELESLPGIGPVTAGRIIAARGEQPFESVEDLRARGLVGESVFADIRDRVRAG